MNKKVWYAIAGVAVAGLSVWGYRQYKLFMDFSLAFKKVRVNKLSKGNLNLDLFFDFTNKSSIKIYLLSQNYDIFINNKYITSLSNKMTNVINPKSVSTIGVNVNVNISDVIKKIGPEASNILLNPEKVNIKIQEKFVAKVGLLSKTINHTYEDTLKNMMG
jgi:LEA14-like dessication related protein